MTDRLTRRSFLATVPALCAAPALFAGSRSVAAESVPVPDGAGADTFPAQDPARVRAMVGAAHGNPDRVRELLAESPALAKAAWDWGFGDWETPLGAASHVGNREIAALLLEHGARPDLFTFAMLGQIEVVRACVAANPGIQRATGPHGLTLLHHARKGGPSAQAVVEFLEALGDADPAPRSQPLTATDLAACAGAYDLDRAGGGRVEVTSKDGTLFFKRLPDGAARGLVHLGGLGFHPVGAPAVRVIFETVGPLATALKVIDGPASVSARRALS